MGYTNVILYAVALILTSEGFTSCGSNRLVVSRKMGYFRQYANINDWIFKDGCEILLPTNQRIPNAAIHFVGGFLAGSAVNIGYSALLRHLASRGYLIIATPIPLLDLDHGKISHLINRSFSSGQKYIKSVLGAVYSEVPVIAIGHSLGGKLLILSVPKLRKSHNFVATIFLAFNNFNAKKSIDFSKEQGSRISPELKSLLDMKEVKQITNAVINSNVGELLTNVLEDTKKSFLNNGKFGTILSEQFESTFSDVIKQTDNRLKDIEFKPSPEETWKILETEYNVDKNILFKFDIDELDQSFELNKILRSKGLKTKLVTLPGDHITPNSIDVKDRNTAIFFRELVFQLDRISDEHWNGSGNVSGTSPGRYLPGTDSDANNDGSSSSLVVRVDWDNDNY